MFNTKFSSTNDKFSSGFTQDKTSANTNFNGYEVLKGEDGFSPEVEITKIAAGHKITITDKEGAESFEIKDGIDGKDGA